MKLTTDQKVDVEGVGYQVTISEENNPGIGEEIIAETEKFKTK